MNLTVEFPPLLSGLEALAMSCNADVPGLEPLTDTAARAPSLRGAPGAPAGAAVEVTGLEGIEMNKDGAGQQLDLGWRSMCCQSRLAHRLLLAE
jgi:hypothetical protein